MKKILLSLAALTVFVMAGGEYTKEVAKIDLGLDKYVGLLVNTTQSSSRVNELDVDGDGLPEFTTSGFGLVGGVEVLRRDKLTLAIEARLLRGYATGEASEDVEVTAGNIFLKPKFTMLEHINIYGLFGSTTVNYVDNYYRLDVTKTGLAGGFGIQMDIQEHFAFTYDAVWSDMESQLGLFANPDNAAVHTVGFLYRF